MSEHPALAILALEDGSIFKGISIGAVATVTGEVVFNTAMTGYQEILTDPSYARQIVTLTYPHIGNTGINPDDVESHRVWAEGLVIRDASMISSNWRSTASLEVYLKENGIPGIAEIDTRRLTRLLRDKGAMSGCLMALPAGTTLEAQHEAEALTAARSFSGLSGLDLAKEVTAPDTRDWTEGTWTLDGQTPALVQNLHVVACDYGVKSQMLRILVDLGCKVTVVPARTQIDEILKLEPDGVLLSNGPGDPEPCDYAIATAAALIERRIPVLGICLGHQILSLACGAQTRKMKFGHHGANHPVRDERSGRVLITSQNHGFAVDADSLPDTLEVTHVSLFDGSLQGVRHRHAPAIGFQGHPEASPGPHDVSPVFEEFVELMRQASGANVA